MGDVWLLKDRKFIVAPPLDAAERERRLTHELDRILAWPDNWDQESWHCKTQHCIAGFAELTITGDPVCNDFGDGVLPGRFETPEGVELLTTAGRAAYYLGLSYKQRQQLFCETRCFEELVERVEWLCKTPYDPHAVDSLPRVFDPLGIR